MEFNYDKLRDAIHYVCERNTALGGTLDDVKLNKVLWYADALMYMTRGQPITGARYIRKPRGPVAKNRNKAVTELLENKCIIEGKVDASGRWPPTLDSIKSADRSRFAPADLQMLDRVYDYVDAESTRAISEQSHGNVWRLAREGEEIPLFTVFAEAMGEPTDADMRIMRSDLG